MEKLKEIASVFRKEETDFIELKEAVKNYENLVSELSDIEPGNENNRNDIQFENGKALGVIWAAMCIQDLIRTKMFIKGLFSAIDSIKKSKKETIQILYAGTGPYATLALPVMASFSSKEVRFTLMEINKISYENVKKVIHALGFENHVNSFEMEDATKYKIPKETDFDIVLSETMQRALEKEQQVPISMNLIRQLKPDAILIPQNISLNLCLLNLSELHGSQNKVDSTLILGTVFEINRKMIHNYYRENGFEDNEIRFSSKKIEIPKLKANEYTSLAILTEIQVFDDVRIKLNESGLTIPFILEDLSHFGNRDLQLEVIYKVDENPGIEYKIS